MNILRKQCKNVDLESDIKLDDTIKNMIDTMNNAEGIGLAAPQVGLNMRLFVVNGKHLQQKDLKDFKKVFINPAILEEYGETWDYREGCLSIPGINININRNTYVKIRYYDEKKQLHTDTFDGMKARIIQHEYDHIQGKLFTDRLSASQRYLIKTKLNNILKGNIKVSYPIKTLTNK